MIDGNSTICIGYLLGVCVCVCVCVLGGGGGGGGARDNLKAKVAVSQAKLNSVYCHRISDGDTKIRVQSSTEFMLRQQ